MLSFESESQLILVDWVYGPGSQANPRRLEVNNREIIGQWEDCVTK